MLTYLIEYYNNYYYLQTGQILKYLLKLKKYKHLL